MRAEPPASVSRSEIGAAVQRDRGSALYAPLKRAAGMDAPQRAGCQSRRQLASGRSSLAAARRKDGLAPAT